MDVAGREGRSFARDARAAKQAAAIGIGIDADYIDSFVERFYAAIRADGLLGPIFAERVENWPEHLAQMKRFWRSVLHNSGEFSGSPMRKHVAIPGLEPRHFAHWLELFYATLRAEEPDQEATRQVGDKARMIADSLLTGIQLGQHGLAGATFNQELPHV